MKASGNRTCIIALRLSDLKAVFPLSARHAARVLYSLGTSMNTPFLQVPMLEFEHRHGVRLQGRDLVLRHKSGHRVRVYTPVLLVLGR